MKYSEEELAAIEKRLREMTKDRSRDEVSLALQKALPVPDTPIKVSEGKRLDPPVFTKCTPDIENAILLYEQEQFINGIFNKSIVTLDFMNQDYSSFHAFVSGTFLIGFVHVVESYFKDARITSFEIVEPLRGQNFGRMLFSEVENWANSHKLSRIDLHSVVESAGFYRKMGMVPVGSHPHVLTKKLGIAFRDFPDFYRSGLKVPNAVFGLTGDKAEICLTNGVEKLWTVTANTADISWEDGKSRKISFWKEEGKAFRLHVSEKGFQFEHDKLHWRIIGKTVFGKFPRKAFRCPPPARASRVNPRRAAKKLERNADAEDSLKSRRWRREYSKFELEVQEQDEQRNAYRMKLEMDHDDLIAAEQVKNYKLWASEGLPTADGWTSVVSPWMITFRGVKVIL
jgi:GNAT superfamily N-acetyltransferase